MDEVTHASQVENIVNAGMIVGDKKFKFANPHMVEKLLLRGFVPSASEFDVRNPDLIIEHGDMMGIQPGRGIISTPDRIKPTIQKKMDDTYGPGNWEFVEIVGPDGQEYAKPMIKAQQQR